MYKLHVRNLVWNYEKQIQINLQEQISGGGK